MSKATQKPSSKAGPKVPDAKGAGPAEIRVAEAEFASGAAQANQIPPTSFFDESPEVAFAGRSNVGKSSLLNMLLSRKGLARTSNTPGRTRQINFFDVRLSQKTQPEGRAIPPRLVFVDLPGYGYAKVSKSESMGWKDLLESYLQERSTLRAVVILVDVRRGIEQEEQDLIEFLGERPDLTVLVAATKMDKLSRSAHKPALAKIRKGWDELVVLPTSAEEGNGRDALWTRILDACREK